MQKKVLRGVAIAAVCLSGSVALQTVVASGDTMFAGSRPKNLGVTEGRLAPPRRTPNCVSSQADPADLQHQIAPISFAGSPASAMDALLRIVKGMEGSSVVRQDAGYLYAEFRSRLMGFVDDVEFSVSAKEGVIHVRSASRLGRRDYGVNRARVESIRAQFAAASNRPVGG